MFLDWKEMVIFIHSHLTQAILGLFVLITGEQKSVKWQERLSNSISNCSALRRYLETLLQIAEVFSLEPHLHFYIYEKITKTWQALEENHQQTETKVATHTHTQNVNLTSPKTHCSAGNKDSSLKIKKETPRDREGNIMSMFNIKIDSLSQQYRFDSWNNRQ